MLLEIAIGDAYGAGFEFSPRAKIDSSNNLSSYVAHELGIAAGCFTDDTQMSVAVAEVLLSDQEPSGDNFADAFVRCYKRDPRKGYAGGFQALLDDCSDGATLRQRINPSSRRNGAAMRAVPLGLIADQRLMLVAAREQARVTHDTDEGLLSAQVVALMAHCLLHQSLAVAELPAAIQRETGFTMRLDWSAEVECDAFQTVHAVATALSRHRSMASLLQACIAFGGDVDSVAAIALGLASLTPEYTADLPSWTTETLEDGPYGRQFLARLDEPLARRFPVLISPVSRLEQ